MKPALAIATALAVGLLAGMIAVGGMGIPLGWAVLIAVPITAAVLLALLAAGVTTPAWHDVPGLQHTITVHQASNLANWFEEAAKDQHRFRGRIQPRLHRLALAILRQRFHDLDSLDDARARAVLGEELHTLLTDRDAKLPSPHRLTQLLSRLEGK